MWVSPLTQVCACGRVHNYKHLQRCMHPVKSMLLTYYTANYSYSITVYYVYRIDFKAEEVLCTQRNYTSSLHLQ